MLRGMAVGSNDATLSRHLIATAENWSALAKSIEAMDAAQEAADLEIPIPQNRDAL